MDLLYITFGIIVAWAALLRTKDSANITFFLVNIYLYQLRKGGDTPIGDEDFLVLF